MIHFYSDKDNPFSIKNLMQFDLRCISNTSGTDARLTLGHILFFFRTS